MIALNSPLKPNLKKLQKVIESIDDSGWYTNFGPVHNDLTARLEDYLGVKNLLLTNNGTSALQVAGAALDVSSLLSTPLSFVATVSAFMWQKSEVAFADVNRQTYNLCADAVDSAFVSGCSADTVVATHLYGNPCDTKAFDAVCDKYKVKIIYDAAHAFGVKLGDNSVLNSGDASILSFHATKVFHTVEGGAIVFKHKHHFDRAKRLINFGFELGTGVVKDIGINAKLNEYQAAVGLVNLDIIDQILEHRASLFYSYRKALESVVELPVWHSMASVNGAYMPIRLSSKAELLRLSQTLADNNIQSRHYFAPSLDRVFIDNVNYGTANTDEIAETLLCLPLHAYMTQDDIKSVTRVVQQVVAQ